MRFSAPCVLALIIACAPSARAAGVHVQLSPANVTVTPGDTVTVQAIVTPADAAFNAFDLILHFDPAHLTFVPQSPISKQLGSLMTGACSQTFHVFIPSADSLTANVSLLCANKSVTGPGTIYSVKFATSASMQGTSTVTCGPATLFYLGGVDVRPVDCTTSTITVGAVGVADNVSPPRASATFDSVRPTPRTGRAPVVISFTLSAAAGVRLDVIDARGRIVARRPAERFTAGSHDVDWRVPRLPAGAYVVRLSAGDRTVLTRTWVVTP